MRTVARRALESVLTAARVPALYRRRIEGRSLVLAYHNVVPDGVVAGERSLHLPLAAFRTQLGDLTKHAAVVPLASLLEPPRSPEPRVAITFDDAYAGALEVGLPEVASRGLPATVFVAPGCLGKESLWWDRFAIGGIWDDRDRDTLLTRHQGADHRIREWAAENGIPVAPLTAWHRIATEAQLQAAAAIPGITLAAHSWSHPNLAALDAAALERELVDSRGWLAERFPCFRPWLAYPYGRTSPAVMAAAREAGYDAALRVTGGWSNPLEEDRYNLPRWNVPAGISRRGFGLRLAGLFCR